MHKIKIGAIIGAHEAHQLPKLVEYGFETFSFIFEIEKNYDMPKVADEILRRLDGTDCGVSNLSVFNNTLDDGERGDSTRNLWHALVDNAHLFGTDIVTGFAGRVTNKPIPDSIPMFKQVFGELADKAQSKNIRIAFENCEGGGDWHQGDWNIAFTPRAWELMFEAVPHDNVGLQWEPCHQMCQLVDPIPQLRKWAKKVFCLHGKDAYTAWDVLRDKGIIAGERYVWHRTPGFGDSNWTEIMTILLMNGFEGTIDIEGFHDPVYKGDLEYTGQVHGLNYLKRCRGGDYHANV